MKPLERFSNSVGRGALTRGALTRGALYAVTLLVFAMILHLMGRVPWCTCGLGLWTSQAMGEETSQHLADPYTFTHVLHGILFYALACLALRHWSVSARCLAAFLLEIAWEILENSPPVIERYREATAARGYYGDSILNSLGDVLFCLVGFALAARLPVKASIALVVIVELGLLVWIRDNLSLNILMLLFPLEAIERWQTGG